MKDSSRVKVFLYSSISASIILLAVFASYFLYNRAHVGEVANANGYGYGYGITGSGYADIEINPDSLVLSFTMTTPASDIANGLVKHIERVASLEKSLMAQGLTKEDIEKSGYQFCNEFCPTVEEGVQIISVGTDTEVPAPVTAEDRISQTFTVTLKNLATSQAIIKILKANKDIKIEATSLAAADYKDRLQEARIEATKKAHENAAQVAAAGNVKLGKVVSIEDSTSSSYSPDGLPVSDVTIRITYEIK